MDPFGGDGITSKSILERVKDCLKVVMRSGNWLLIWARSPSVQTLPVGTEKESV
jgi:hypothetical protein